MELADRLLNHRAVVTSDSIPGETLAGTELTEKLLANGDIWELMFNFLHVKTRIRLEMANKRLRFMMFSFWKRQETFKVSCIAELSKNPPKRAEAIVGICIDRIGDSLRSLKLGGDIAADVRSIGQGCPNVESIHCTADSALDYEQLKARASLRFDSFTNLTSLSFCTDSLDGFVRLPAVALLSTPTSIQRIVGFTTFYYDAFESPSQMEAFFADRTSLREVRLRRLHTRNRRMANIFPVIAERCTQLKTIQIQLDSSDIDEREIVALSSLRELRLKHTTLTAAQVAQVCEQSQNLEILEVASNTDERPGNSAESVLSAIGALRRLVELTFSCFREPTSAQVTRFVHELARNSGASLRCIDLNFHPVALSTAAIEALANGCPKLRRVYFSVCAGTMTLQCVRHLIDCIVADPDWKNCGGTELELRINVVDVPGHSDGSGEGAASFDVNATTVASLPAGVMLHIN